MEDFNLVLLHKEKSFSLYSDTPPGFSEPDILRLSYLSQDVPSGVPGLLIDRKSSGESRREYHGSNLKLPRLSGHTAAVYHN
ncbi:MAG: hypothetical protein J6112_05575 [Clostridia bacterium]|nr:hypothetical protein [Clostridia bacterium]